jgi:DNA polymerase
MKYISLFRDVNMYITNIVFWRPPENRKPTSKEVEQCKPFLEKHIALIKPRLIIAVGSTAATALIGKNFEITKMRKQYFEYNNIYLDKPVDVTAIFHPAYLIRQSSQKKNTWYDLLAIKEYIQKLGI